MRVGVALPIGERGPEKRAHPYTELRAMAVAAEQGGADSIWVADHLFYENDGDLRGMWESISVLAALADATDTVELGPLVMCVPFRNPGLIAWMCNTIDEISGGRFVVGLGSGWHEPEFAGFDFNFARRVSVFDESLQVSFHSCARANRTSTVSSRRAWQSSDRQDHARARAVHQSSLPAQNHEIMSPHRQVRRSLEQRLVRATDRGVPGRATRP